MSEPRGFAAPITLPDESYTHQLVASAATTLHEDPAWAERCWHLVHLGDGWVLGAGRALNAYAGKRTAKIGLSTGDVQHARRTLEPFSFGDDPDRPDVGPIRIEAVRPLQEVRIVLDDPASSFAVDLTYEARFPAVPTGRNRIEVRGEVVTDYMNFFQSGRYSGVVVADGEERTYDSVLGFRDRGWGLRKHEGSAKRGMHIFCACELENEALYFLVYENARAERMFTNAWLIDESGLVDTGVTVEHELRQDGRLTTGGRLSIGLASGDTRELEFTVEGRMWMETVGYTAIPERAAPGADRFDLTDPAVRTALLGLFDNGARFTVDGKQGNGFVEVGLGIHARYRPEAAEPA
jgi:hypothetical protein